MGHEYRIVQSVSCPNDGAYGLRLNTPLPSPHEEQRCQPTVEHSVELDANTVRCQSCLASCGGIAERWSFWRTWFGARSRGVTDEPSRNVTMKAPATWEMMGHEYRILQPVSCPKLYLIVLANKPVYLFADEVMTLHSRKLDGCAFMKDVKHGF